MDPNFEGQLQPIFEGHLLTRVFESCPEAIRKASECTLEKYCHEFNYNMDECDKDYAYQEVSCIKNNTGKSQGHAWSYLSISNNYNPHVYTTLNSFTAYCPDGYYYEKGELHGASIEGGVLLSLEDCGSRCRNNRKCQSFEHNSFNNHCFLNNGSHPNSPRNTESLFCSKKG